jgi:hypothetical protein
MAIKRPKGREPKFEVPDTKFIDEMVRASLAVNPSLKNGETTSKYLERMRQVALGGKSIAPAAPAAAAPTPPSESDKRQTVIRQFLELRGDDLAREVEEIQARQRELAEQEAQVKQRAAEDIVDHITVVTAAGADLSMVKSCLREAKALLSQLGVTENEILRRVNRKG